MDKGIRPYCNNKFVELNERRRRGELSNTQFRKNVIADVMEQFGITLASAATHYNHAFKNLKELNAELVSGLGRPEDKKGGRKPKAKPEAAPATNDDSATMSDVASSVMLGGDDSSDDAPPPAAQITLEASQVGLEGLGQQEEAPQGDAPQEPAVQTFSVYKVAKGTLVAEGLTREQADELVAKAAAAKKAKLEVR
jgi:hypothetical protein